MQLRKLLNIGLPVMAAITVIGVGVRVSMDRTKEKDSLNERVNINNTANNLLPIAILPASQYASSPNMIKGDFNKDGYEDLAVVQTENDGWRQNTKVYVFYNDGKGNFSTTNNYNSK